MFIYIARHAWAGHFGDANWENDSLRELEPEGAERYTHVIRTLAERGFQPERIATSPYVRCRQTAEIIAKHVPGKPSLEELQALAPGSKLRTLMQWTVGQDGRDVCWCGHNPDVQDLTAALIGGGSIRFAKGAIAAVCFEGKFDVGAGELYWHVSAKSLGL